MKKHYLLFATAFIMGANAIAQPCLLSDSISAGEGAGTYHMYYYNSFNAIEKVERIDSGSVSVSEIDTFYYTGTLLDSSVSSYEMSGTWYRNQKKTFTYNGSGQITRVLSETGLSSGTPSAMAHDLTYNGSGRLTAVTLDASSIVGSPEGFQGTFQNMVWDANGNISTLEMVLSGTTMNLTCTYDTKNNIQRLLPKRDAPSIMLGSTANNITLLVVSGLGNGLDRDYMYTGDEVEEMVDNPAAFGGGSTIQYAYQTCTGTAIQQVVDFNKITMFPNPGNGTINLAGFDQASPYQVFNVGGQLVDAGILNQGQNIINLNHLNNGAYIVRVQHNNEVTNMPYYLVK